MRRIQDSSFGIQNYKRWIVSLLCVFFFAGYVYSQGLVVMAKKVSGELPVDPGDSLWRTASGLAVPLAPQVMAKPRIYESEIKELNVKALHNSKEIAFLLEWEDLTEDSSIDIDKFSDAVALEFPAHSINGRPHFAMGDRDNLVNIWLWKASWQKTEEQRRLYAMVDDFAGGIEVDNPVSVKRRYPVENLIANGFGSATDLKKSPDQDIIAKGIRDGKRWLVVFKRSLSSQEKSEVSFKEGAVTPVAFAVWNGSEGHAGGRKVVSTWYYVGLETEERIGTYIYPVIAFIMSAAIMTGIIFIIRKKRL